MLSRITSECSSGYVLPSPHIPFPLSSTQLENSTKLPQIALLLSSHPKEEGILPLFMGHHPHGYLFVCLTSPGTLWDYT